MMFECGQLSVLGFRFNWNRKFSTCPINMDEILPRP